MRDRFKAVRCLSFFLTMALLAAVSPASARSTAFTYQGSLDDAGVPASGLHDFRFKLFDAVTGGTQVGTVLCSDNVSVVEGVFTVQLDFGQQFATAQRFMEVEVRRDTGLTCSNATGFAVLTPRQQLTATPVALHANSAFALDAADGSPASAVFVDNGGKVGIGTTSPAMQVHVQGSAPVMVLQDTASPSNQAGYLAFWNSLSAETGWVGYGLTGSPQFSILNNRTGGDLRLYTGTGGDINLTPGTGGDVNLVGGNVGLGTFTPAAKLDVRGNIKLGSSGQYSALGGHEDLRVLRGDIDGDGTILRGDGFSVNRVQEGRYAITFTPPFSGIPTITASTETQVSNIRWVFVDLWNLSGQTADLSVLNLNGAPTNSKFSICVIGPR